MSVTISQREADLRPQDLPTVLRAEFGRLLRQGGLRTGLLVTAAVALGAGLIAVGVLAYLSSADPDSPSSLPVTVPVEVTTAIAAVLLSGAVVLNTGRAAQTGATATSLALVPNRRRLFLAQAVATSGLALVVTALLSTVVVITALALSGAVAALPVAVVGVLSGSVAAALLAALAFFLATLVNRAIAGILVYVGWWVVLPLALTVAAPAVPEWAVSVVTAAAAAIPTALLAEATTVSTLTTLGAGALLRGLLGLALWAGAFGVVAGVVFRRRSL